MLWVETQPGDGATIPRGVMQTHNITHLQQFHVSYSAGMKKQHDAIISRILTRVEYVNSYS